MYLVTGNVASTCSATAGPLLKILQTAHGMQCAAGGQGLPRPAHAGPPRQASWQATQFQDAEPEKQACWLGCQAAAGPGCSCKWSLARLDLLRTVRCLQVLLHPNGAQNENEMIVVDSFSE